MTALKRYLMAKQYKAKENLLAKIHREIEPTLEAMRQAESDTYANRHDLENSPELYGHKIIVPDAYRLASNGNSADCEISEMDRRRIHASSHDHSTESMLKPA